AQRIERLYRGDLLEGWYHDWCLFERERIKAVYISLVDKLMAYCEANSIYEQGINYGRKLIEMDPTYESAYQHMIRLFINSGDRISALRLFESCQKALRNEFNIGPGNVTLNLYKLINTGGDKSDNMSDELSDKSIDRNNSIILKDLSQIKKAIYDLVSVQQKILAEIRALKEKQAR
ncbi:MAG: bacterial transcriptional activator domain-containing protein, partial [Anaerolineales bacterium]